MTFLRSLLAALPTLLACLCVATATAQAIAIGLLWSSGELNQQKLVRYAAVLYGVDLRRLEAGRSPNEQRRRADEELKREAILNKRVHADSLLTDRQAAALQSAEESWAQFQELRSEADRVEQRRSDFEARLEELEADVRETALQEVRQTLEMVRPEQAKTLILRMLDDQGNAPADDVVADVVKIVKAMPQDRLKRILGEFETLEERETLHEIILKIGKLDQMGAAKQGGVPQGNTP